MSEAMCIFSDYYIESEKKEERGQGGRGEREKKSRKRVCGRNCV
jgi:hypothetical protein